MSASSAIFRYTLRVLALVTICVGYQPTELHAQPTGGPSGKYFERVLIVVLENQNFSSAMKDPFLSSLATKGAFFTNYHGLYHPSYPNYLSMIAGSSFGVDGDGQKTFPADDAHRTVSSLLDWKNYAEDYPTFPQPFLGDKGKYARRHVPFLSFAAIQKDGFKNVVSVDTKDPHNAFVEDVRLFRQDRAKHPLPRYMLYTPNLDDDGHDPVLDPQKGLAKASNWLKHFLTEWFPLDETTKGTLVVITFDESEGHEQTNRIYTIFLGDMIKPGGIAATYTHYNLLRTIEENFGLGTLNTGDKAAAPIVGIWK